jgi:DNA-binding FrmR family transcriptional regulator
VNHIYKRGKILEFNNQIKNRVKRVDGLFRGILKMMEDNKDCRDVITQLSAARTALDRIIGVIVSSNLVECIQNENSQNVDATEDLMKEVVDLLIKR